MSAVPSATAAHGAIDETVSLDAATEAEAPLLANLLELYTHDLSAIFAGVELGPDGRFGFKDLASYWTEPTRRFPFLVRVDARVAGFALARRGSPADPDPHTLDVAEFFVLRRYRRSGVGRRAAHLLWTILPGTWTVRVAESNRGALGFWKEVVGSASNGMASERTMPGAWRVFTFEAG